MSTLSLQLQYLLVHKEMFLHLKWIYFHNCTLLRLRGYAQLLWALLTSCAQEHLASLLFPPQSFLAAVSVLAEVSLVAPPPGPSIDLVGSSKPNSSDITIIRPSQALSPKHRIPPLRLLVPLALSCLCLSWWFLSYHGWLSCFPSTWLSNSHRGFPNSSCFRLWSVHSWLVVFLLVEISEIFIFL